jgi:hypothetical protein
MSYTPPDYNAADFSFQSAPSYTPPDYYAASFDFGALIPKGRITGGPSLGIPGALVSQQIMLVVGTAVAGLPAAVTSHLFALASASAGLGWPEVHASHQVGWVSCPPGVGAPQVVGRIPQMAWVQGIPASGYPEGIASQSFAVVTGGSAGGTPQSAVNYGFSALVGGLRSLGTPQAVSALIFRARVQGQPASGISSVLMSARPQAWVVTAAPVGVASILSRSGFLAIAQPLPAIGMAKGISRSGWILIARPTASAGTPRAFAWSLPATAVVIPPGVTLYFCKITGAADGLADAVLPISNFSVRHRVATDSYYNVTVPSFAKVADLAARTHGEIVLWSERAGVSEELMRGSLGDVSVARGPNSQSISISGNASRAATPPYTYVLTEALYTSTTFAGDVRLRIEPRAAIRPGDYVRYHDLNFAVGEVTWSVAVSAGGMAVTMEVARLPVESGS